jgi:transposase
MIRIKFTKEGIEELQWERFNNPSPKVQLKMEALYLKSKALPHSMICEVCDITRATLAAYLKEYIAGGIEELREINYKGKENELLKNASSIEEYFSKHPAHSLKEARARIEEITGIKRSLPQIWKFFKRMKFKYRKVKAIPGKALREGKQEEQDGFVKEELAPRLQEAKLGEREIFLWMPPILSTRHS